MKGFVQENGRSTKGGSLPLAAGARKLGRFFRRYLSGENGSNTIADDMRLYRRASSSPHQNGHRVVSTIEPTSRGNGADSVDNQCPPFLQKLIVERVSFERTEICGASVNGNGHSSPSNGNGHSSPSNGNGHSSPSNGNGHSSPSNGNGHSSRAGVNGNGHSSPSLSRSGALSYSRFAQKPDATSLLEPESENIAPAPMPRWKRILDLTCIGITLPFWLPLMILVMLWIKLVSPGPIFFRQPRVGCGRRQFMIFKFRTMRVNAETRTHAEYFARLMREDCPMTKLDHGDPRLIACGRFLRASGLDELPQIFNVICGDMSLVGPRPCLPHEFDWYEPWQQQRANVFPGLTGYWQVNGKNHTTFSEMIAMDIFYSRNMSLRLDLAIIFKTVPALVTQTLESRAASRTIA